MSCHEPVRARGQLVACSYCPGCRSRRSATWALRLGDEYQEWDRSCFLTLTISDEIFSDPNAPDPTRVRRRDLQLFFKRLRKSGFRFKYYAVGEYGERSARAHYHLILFGLDRRDRVAIEAAWPWGIVDIGNVEPASIRYVTGYVMKAPLGRLRVHAERTDKNPPFSVMSQKIGASGAVARRHTLVTQGVVRVGSRAVVAPRYYVGRLSEEDKRAFILARRDRELKAALARVAEGGDYVRSAKWKRDRAVVSSRDFAARQVPRGTL